MSQRLLPLLRRPSLPLVCRLPVPRLFINAKYPTMSKPRRPNINHGRSKKQKKAVVEGFQGTNTEIVESEVKSLLAKSPAACPVGGDNELEAASSPRPPAAPERWSEVEVRIAELSSTGDGLGFSSSLPGHVFAVPYSLPGEVVKAKVVRTFGLQGYSEADLLEVVESSPSRDNGRVKCQYFARCAGCHFQMLSYEDQLAHKKSVIERAYCRFSDLTPESIPTIGNVIGSPLQYGYRTKLTPHFPAKTPDDMYMQEQGRSSIRPVGFTPKGRRMNLDIEDCPIGTDAVRKGLKSERERLTPIFDSFKRGATLILRESTERTYAKDAREDKQKSPLPDGQHSRTKDEKPGQDHMDVKRCITSNSEMAKEYVDDFVFAQKAGAFFQNNNSILPVFTQYVREQVIVPSLSPPLNQLIDAYCGSGLFTVTLSSIFATSFGIDVSRECIEAARRNAALNNIQNATFIEATASAIFRSLPTSVDPDRTAVVIDPPRKGCDSDFLRQLLQFRPRRILYVSCNVHTQARDVGVLVEGAGKDARYNIESICGFDFFPQTHHVESVAVLQRVDDSKSRDS